MEYEKISNLLEFHEEVKAPPDFTLNIMKEVRRIKKDKINPALYYRAWGISLIAASAALLIINVSGIHGEPDYNIFLEKTSIVQRSITLSVDETSRTILQIFNNITDK